MLEEKASGMDITPETIETIKVVAKIGVSVVSAVTGSSYVVWKCLSRRMRGKVVHADLEMKNDGKLHHLKFEIEESNHPPSVLNT